MKAADSIILRAVAAGLFFFVNLFALYLLLRGHNLPGGGFIGGLGSALSFILLALGFGVEKAQRVLRVDPVRLAALGLAVALASSLAPVFVGAEFLRQYNWKLADLLLLGDLAVGTPLVFDIGVFLVVLGVTTKLVFVLARALAGLPMLNQAERARYASAIEEPLEENPRLSETKEDAR
jgi:multicomponent Na+:H+ antiporter subunit B